MRVGVIGLGYRMGYLARVFNEMVPGFSVIGYVDPAPAGLAYAEKFGVSMGEAMASPEALVSRDDIDLVMVGSPNHLHLGHIRTALEAGKKVFAEKPVVTTVEETLALARLIAAYPADQVMVGLVLRYAPLYVELRRAQAEGHLGEIVSIEASEHIPPQHGAFFQRDWRRYEKYTGGFMLEKCCHDLDLYNGVMGCRPLQVASFGGRKSFIPENAPEAEGVNDLEIYHAKPSGWMASDKVFDGDGDIIDFQVAIVRYENGAALTFHTNMNAPDDFRRFAVFGARGQAEGDFIRNFFRLTDARTGTRLAETSFASTELSQHYGADEQMAQDIAAHLREGVPLPVSVIDALEAGLLAMAMDEARRTDSVIDMRETWTAFDAALGRTA
jgi:predicted dehydrogenase